MYDDCPHTVLAQLVACPSKNRHKTTNGQKTQQTYTLSFLLACCVVRVLVRLTWISATYRINHFSLLNRFTHPFHYLILSRRDNMHDSTLTTGYLAVSVSPHLIVALGQ